MRIQSDGRRWQLQRERTFSAENGNRGEESEKVRKRGSEKERKGEREAWPSFDSKKYDPLFFLKTASWWIERNTK